MQIQVNDVRYNISPLSCEGWSVTCADASGRYYWHENKHLGFEGAKKLAAKIEAKGSINPAHWLTMTRDGRTVRAVDA